MTNPAALKPCPFCGSTDLVEMDDLYIECRCGAFGPNMDKGETPTEAWNGRVPQQFEGSDTYPACPTCNGWGWIRGGNATGTNATECLDCSGAGVVGL